MRTQLVIKCDQFLPEQNQQKAEVTAGVIPDTALQGKGQLGSQDGEEQTGRDDG